MEPTGNRDRKNHVLGENLNLVKTIRTESIKKDEVPMILTLEPKVNE